MFFRIRTRLLAAGGLTIVLLAVLALLITYELLSLGPMVEQINRLSSLAAKTRDLTQTGQDASSDLYVALAGGTGGSQNAQNFTYHVKLLEEIVAGMRQEFAAVNASPGIQAQAEQLAQTLTSYRQVGEALFAAVDRRFANPSPETKAAAEQAVEPTSRLNDAVRAQIQALNTAVNGEADAAWQRLRGEIATMIAILVGLALLIMVVTMLVQIRTALAVGRSVTTLAEAARRIEAGDLAVDIPVTRRDEIGDLGRSFNAMASALRHGREELEDQNRRLEGAVQARTSALQETVARLEATLAERSALRTLLQGVSTPVLPVASGVLLMPLIGVLDDERARQALHILLQRIASHGARTVILDITGLPMIDGSVAATLLKATRAVRLLGARIILAGVSPEVAQALVSLGIGLDGFQSVGDLQAAVALALRGAADVRH